MLDMAEFDVRFLIIYKIILMLSRLFHVQYFRQVLRRAPEVVIKR